MASRIAALAVLAALGATCTLAGCYERVVHSGITSTEVKEVYAPSVDEGPSTLNEILWGSPPKGEDPVKYYRRKNSLGLQE